MLLIYVMAGGAFGALMRYLLANWLRSFSSAPFPFPTLIVNIIGCFLLGAWVAYAAHIMPKGRELHALLAIGVCGGFTTFSAFSYDTILLLDKGLIAQAALYVFASVAVSLVAMFAAMLLIKFLLQ